MCFCVGTSIIYLRGDVKVHQSLSQHLTPHIHLAYTNLPPFNKTIGCPQKKFPVQQVAVIVVSRVAAIFFPTFCLFGRKILSIFAK